jgi:hypothetical protein
VFLCSTIMFSQNRKGYYIEMKPNVDLGTINKTVNPDQTISITTAINSFSNLVNSKNVYEFKQAFPGISSERLQRVFYIEFPENETVQAFSQQVEIENFIEIEKPDLLFDFPNDYVELPTLQAGPDELFDNTSLEIIKAPLAWTVTQGDPNILVGVIDSKFDLTHPDLQNKIAINLDNPNNNDPNFHGTQVANLVAGDTNNGVGIASIGYNTRLVTADVYNNVLRVWEVAQIPGVKVINCSWASSVYNEIDEILYQKIRDDLGVLVVAASGNNKSWEVPNAYMYPASYHSVMSVTSVGSRYNIGEFYPQNQWTNSWKDVHEYRNVGADVRTHNHNDKVDVSSPAQMMILAGDNYNSPDVIDGYFLGTGTSGAAPMVSGLAALIYAINPNFTPQKVRAIIRETTDDIYHIPNNQNYIGQLGTGRINAFRAVKKASCIMNPSDDLDLAMQNSRIDGFQEPDLETEYLWESKDISVRNQSDGTYIKTHENPVYSANSPNYAYVRITNNSCETSNGSDNAKLYWAKANTELTWPLHWTGNLTVPNPDDPNSPILMGDEIGVQSIPFLEPGESTIIEFPWFVPNPEDYESIDNEQPWHFCLLARIESTQDPMTFTEIANVTENVKNNNNIAWKNTTINNIITNSSSNISGVVGVGNSLTTARTSYLEFVTDTIANVTPLYDAAEVLIEMDSRIYNGWQTGGSVESNFKQTKISSHKIVNGQKPVLDNIVLPADTYNIINVSFNFLTDKKDNRQHYTFRVIHRDAITDEIIGGETYEINKYPRPTFQADAGGDEEIEKDESVTITAAQINEAAIYNWYDPDGNLVYTGRHLTVSPNITKTYTLEIISDRDGYKDYDEIEIKVNPYKIESLVPNPTSNLVTINYDADEASSAYLMIVGTQNNTSNNYILNPQETFISLDVSTYESGIYAIALVCDGVIVGSKNLYKN